MWRYFVGAAGALLMAVAAMFLFRGSAATEAPAVPPPPPQTASEPLPDAAPAATEKTREEKRFNRVDRDKDGIITREEYLRLRKRAYAKLDTNGDGRLSFDEWAISTTKKFEGADKDKSKTLTRAEFATTAVKRKAPPPKCACGPAKPAAKLPPPDTDPDDGDE